MHWKMPTVGSSDSSTSRPNNSHPRSKVNLRSMACSWAKSSQEIKVQKNLRKAKQKGNHEGVKIKFEGCGVVLRG